YEDGPCDERWQNALLLPLRYVQPDRVFGLVRQPLAATDVVREDLVGELRSLRHRDGRQRREWHTVRLQWPPALHLLERSEYHRRDRRRLRGQVARRDTRHPAAYFRR